MAAPLLFVARCISGIGYCFDGLIRWSNHANAGDPYHFTDGTRSIFASAVRLSLLPSVVPGDFATTMGSHEKQLGRQIVHRAGQNGGRVGQCGR